MKSRQYPITISSSPSVIVITIIMILNLISSSSVVYAKKSFLATTRHQLTTNRAAFGFNSNRNKVFKRSSSKGVRYISSMTKGQMTMWGEDDSFDIGGDSSKPTSIPKARSFTTGTTPTTAPRRNNNDGFDMDDSGRTIRRGRSSTRDDDDRRSYRNNSYNDDNDDGWGGGSSSRSQKRRSSDDDGNDDGFSVDTGNNGGDYFEPYEYNRGASKNRRSMGEGRGGRGRGGRGGGGGRSGRGGRGGRGRGRGGFRDRDDGFERGTRMNRMENNQNAADDKERKINMRALEGAGFVHLYGLAPVINALKVNRRDLENIDSFVNLELLEGEELEHEMNQRDRKPEAQFTPHLFVQENMKYGSGGKTGDKAAAANEVEELAKKMNVPIAYVDKGVLNALCGNRPHQGYVLRCGKIEFEQKSQIPRPEETESPSLWLCLDEVVDPQNFGALLRSAHFLGGGESTGVGIMVCAKNSAPPTPVVSAASAGALELCQVYSTSNLPRTLNAAKENGWRVLGAAASAPSGMIDETTGEEAACQDLNEIDVDNSKPTILVLGSEGHGLRNLVSRACTGFVRVPGCGALNNNDDGSQAGVDSLNVSVTGGIMLWHFLSGNK